MFSGLVWFAGAFGAVMLSDGWFREGHFKSVRELQEMVVFLVMLLMDGRVGWYVTTNGI